VNGGTVLFSSAPRQNVLRNFRQWICVVERTPPPSVPPPSAGAVIVMLIATVACMFLVDTAAGDWARGLPQWFDDVFERIADLGWFLFPLGFILLCLAAVTSPLLTPPT
jgi:hypothetical protein